jgi:two-component system, OmpR family, phosphate regulon response regulator OmpR
MARKSKALPRPRILIVDDEESTRLLLARILARALRAEMTLAGTSEQALKLAGHRVYDAILLDLMMPGIGGYELLRKIRAASPNAATPVVVVSALTDQQSKDRTLAAGANAYVVKPIERRSLVEALRAPLGERKPPAPPPA